MNDIEEIKRILGLLTENIEMLHKRVKRLEAFATGCIKTETPSTH